MAHNENKTRINVLINHQEYTVVTNESQTYIQELADLLNKKMEEIKENNKALDTRRVAVLAAMNIMDDYLKLKKDYDTFIQLIEEEDKAK